MRRAFWIAVDLLMDLRARGTAVWLGGLLFLWWPFQTALLDGLSSRSPWGSGTGLRSFLVLNAAWPAMLMSGLIAETILPRRLGRSLEPLLASPVTEAEIAAALAMPVVSGAVLSPLLTFPLNLAGYALGAGGPIPDPGWELARTTLGSLAAGAWLAASTIDAAGRAAGQAAYLARILAGCAAVTAIDLALLAARLCGRVDTEPAILATATAAGGLAIAWAARRVDREMLLVRM